MAALKTPQVITHAGIVLSYDGVEPAGNHFLNSGKCFIAIKNNSTTASRTVTINSQRPCDYDSDHDIAVAISQTEDQKLIGPFPKDRFNFTDGMCYVTYSDDGADMEIAVFELP